MKKLILLLLILLSAIGFSQNQYKSSKMSFVYAENYKIKDERIMQDVLVKLVSKNTSNTENIIVNMNYEYTSLDDVDKQSLNKKLISETDNAMKTLGTSYETTIISSKRKVIFGKEIISTLIKTELPKYYTTLFQLTYLYVKNGKSCYIIISDDKENDYTPQANLILKELMFF